MLLTRNIQMRTDALSICLAAIVLLAGVSIVPLSASGQQEQPQADPAISVSAEPTEPVTAGSTFEVTYTIRNVGEASGAFTVEAEPLPTNVSVTEFSGDVQGPNPDGSPPSTSTTAIAAGSSATVTITYRSVANATGEQRLGIQATQSIDQTTDDEQTTVTLSQPQASPSITVTDAPDVASPGGEFEVTYEISNTGTQNSSFTLSADRLPASISVTQFAGDIQAPTPDASPPRVSTVSLPGGSASTTASITITYRADESVTGEQSLGVTAEAPLSGAADNTSSTVIVEDPTDRALQAASADQPEQISQDDITIAITKRDRGEQLNNINVTQDDITILITLRNRAG